MYLVTWTPMILSLCTAASYLASDFSASPVYLPLLLVTTSTELLVKPGNLLLECGTSIPPSQAPFKTPKHLAPVVVLLIPTSRRALNGLFSPSKLSDELKYSPSILSAPL